MSFNVDNMATLISWTDETWNPVTGCSRVSEGCRNCYAERLSLRFGWSKKPWTSANAAVNVRCHADRLEIPLRLKRPSRIFTNSMSDMFHPQVPDAFLARIFDVMTKTPQHAYQILTKRPERAAEWPGPWTQNIWMGTSIEDAKVVNRADHLRRCDAHVRFISAEPLLGPLMPALDLTGIDWVIVGGESGPGFRPMDHAWARALRDECVRRKVAFFFKQDAAFRTETRPYLVEADGSLWEWRQYPGALNPPKQVAGRSIPTVPELPPVLTAVSPFR
jgi:protein gp37